VSGLGEIKEGDDLADYSRKYSFFTAFGYTSGIMVSGTLLAGGVLYAGYLKLQNKKKATPK